MVSLLTPAEVARYAALPLTYDTVGITLDDQVDVVRRRKLGHSDFDRAATGLFGWQVHERSGLYVRASADRASLDAVVISVLGIGRVGIKAPCRVVRVVDQPDRAGFAYGTLPGHPESGEELFLVEKVGDEVYVEIRAVSTHASVMARLGSPVARRVQSWMTERYLRALD
ncbi:MAG: DUF1990 domain-containing protein [Nocardioidaceae bacterium]